MWENHWTKATKTLEVLSYFNTYFKMHTIMRFRKISKKILIIIETKDLIIDATTHNRRTLGFTWFGNNLSPRAINDKIRITILMRDY
jgi:hypothetical protein